MNSPVAIFIFNRPSTTRKVFSQIKKIKPKELILIADGPRIDSDIELCQECKKIVEDVDWECNIHKNYSSQNLGVIERYISGLDWIFSIFESAIILDDDCVPDLSFFLFCDEMLEKFKDVDRVMLVSGQTMTTPGDFEEYSYYFSKYALVWGWATWRDSWKKFHFGMHLWPYLRKTNWLSDKITNSVLYDYWRKSFNRAYDGKVKTWDYQWMFVFFIFDGLSVISNRNLISNIGFGPDSVNTKDVNSENANLPTYSLKFPLLHPLFVENNESADKIIAEKLWISRYIDNNYIVSSDGFIYE